jgi:hypothetical protein
MPSSKKCLRVSDNYRTPTITTKVMTIQSSKVTIKIIFLRIQMNKNYYVNMAMC